MYHRSDVVLANDSNGKPSWGASYTVTVYPVGAIASANSSGTTATVDAGHSFQPGDKAAVWDGTTFTFVAEAVDSATKTTVVWSTATPSISSGDKLVNLGPDTASGSTANFDASPVVIFSDSDGSSAISNSRVTTDSTVGSYGYYYRGDGAAWEVVRDSNSAVQGVVTGFGGENRRNVADYGAALDGATVDTARVKSALLTADPVFVPAGSLLVSSSLTVYAGGVLSGVGLTSKIVFDQNGTPNAGIVNDTNAGDITIRDLYIDHDGNTAASTVSAIEITGGTGSNYLLENLHIIDAGRDGIRVVGASGTVTNARVRNCTVLTADRHGIEFASDVTSSSIVGCRVRDTNTVTAGAGIYAGSAASAENIVASDNIVEAFGDNGIRTIGVNCTISNNTVDGESVANAVDGIRLAGSQNSARGNVVRNCTESGIKAENGSDYVVADNVSTGNTQHGIIVRFSTAYPEYGSVANNVCGSNTMDGILVFGAKNLQLSGNVCRSNSDHGLRIEGGDVSASGKICDFINVSGNTFYSNGTSHNDILVTVTDSGSIGTVKISGNSCDGASSGNGGITIADAGTLVEITDNHSANHVTSDISIVAGPFIRHRGTGAPTLGAKNGSVWYRTDGAANEALYIRENAAWVEVGAA